MLDTSNTSARRARRIRHECDTSDMSDTRVKRATWATRVQHECYTNDTSATRVLHERQSVTRVKKSDFDSGRSKNTFLHHYIYYMASERLQGEEQFHSKNFLLEMPCFHAKMRLKSAPQKLNFLMTKAISQRRTLGCSCKCPCTLPHSYAQ